MDRFTRLFARAGEHAPFDHTAMSLGTADASGRPAVRIVLLHGLDTRGFVFFTNYDSRKGRDLATNPQAALCFYWPTLDEQIRVEGRVERATTDESDAYFTSRPRGSQLGAWASAQSHVLATREQLEQEYRAVESRFADATVPRPPFWGGFRIIPSRIEFWYGRPDRLHDRLVYTREGDGWKIERLYP